MEFFEAPAFTRHLGTYLDDAGLLALQLSLIDHPEAGKVMPGTGGFRKLRWGDETRSKGKRGGLRMRGAIDAERKARQTRRVERRGR